MTDKIEDAWRAELKRRGLENVKLKLMAAGVGRGANVRGFESPSEIPRDFVEDWVAAEERKAIKERRWTLTWAIVGGPASEGFSRDQENSGTFAANASPARQHPLRNVL
jgi:hypothetical protein